METIKFSQNWNNKLSNKAFTTLRLHNPNKYRRGQYYKIESGGQLRGIAGIKEIRTFRLASLNDFVSYLDTGYSTAETKQLLQRMYKAKNINWDTQLLDFCLLVYEKESGGFID
jgi:hypothetical protein